MHAASPKRCPFTEGPPFSARRARPKHTKRRVAGVGLARTGVSPLNTGFEYREQVGPEATGQCVLAYLARRYRHSTETVWHARIAAGEVLPGGSRAGAADLLRAGQTLVWRRPPWEEPAVPLAFAVLPPGDHLPAVATPRG